MRVAVGAGRVGALSAWEVLAKSCALRFVAQDMGNGVRRLLSSELVPLDQAKAEATHSGRQALQLPPPEWLVDLSFSALESMGIDTDRSSRARMPVVYSHPISDDMIELLCWRA